MKKFFIPLLLALLFCSTAHSVNKVPKLRAGDIILVPLNCYSCTIIERETRSRYSHSGIVIFNESGKIMIGESLGETHLVSLKTFLLRVRPGRKAGLYRHFESNKIKPRDLLKTFRDKFDGLPFDSKYLWNNFEDSGRELLYCSEFITKLLNHFLRKKLVPSPMDFSRNWSYWEKVYGVGNVPQGEPGNSPGDIEKSKDFKFLGNL